MYRPHTDRRFVLADRSPPDLSSVPQPSEEQRRTVVDAYERAYRDAMNAFYRRTPPRPDR